MVVQEGSKHKPEQVLEIQPRWTPPYPKRNLTLRDRVVICKQAEMPSVRKQSTRGKPRVFHPDMVTIFSLLSETVLLLDMRMRTREPSLVLFTDPDVLFIHIVQKRRVKVPLTLSILLPPCSTSIYKIWQCAGFLPFLFKVKLFSHSPNFCSSYFL